MPHVDDLQGHFGGQRELHVAEDVDQARGRVAPLEDALHALAGGPAHGGAALVVGAALNVVHARHQLVIIVVAVRERPVPGPHFVKPETDREIRLLAAQKAAGGLPGCCQHRLQAIESLGESATVREELAKYISQKACTACEGQRLNREARHVFVSDTNLPTITAWPIEKCLQFFAGLELKGHRGEIARKIVKEVHERLNFLVNVGLDYLTLDRKADSLSGGEAQRIRLASQIGAGLVGVMYILDEPSIGLHQRDNERLLATLTRLRDLGNTVIVVEHDEEAIRTALDRADAVIITGGIGPTQDDITREAICAATGRAICTTSSSGKLNVRCSRP